jgi:hypothetical protein
MKKSTSKTPAATISHGQVLITLDGQLYPIRFSLNVLRDWGKLTGYSPSDFGRALANDYLEAFTSIIVCSVHRFVPALAEFTQDQAADALEAMSQEEADILAKAIIEATTAATPLLAALNRQFAVQQQPAAQQEALNPVAPTESSPAS